jgi:hypothetical protein
MLVQHAPGQLMIPTPGLALALVDRCERVLWSKPWKFGCATHGPQGTLGVISKRRGLSLFTGEKK